MTKSPRPLQNQPNEPPTQDAQIGAWADNVITLLGLSESSAEDGQTEPDFDHPQIPASSRFAVSDVEEVSLSEDEESDDELEQPLASTASPTSRFTVSDVDEPSLSGDEESNTEPEQPQPTVTRFEVSNVEEVSPSEDELEQPPTPTASPTSRFTVSNVDESSLSEDEESDTEPEQPQPTASRFEVSNVDEDSSSEDELEQPPTSTASPANRFTVSNVDEPSLSEDEESAEELPPVTMPLPSDNLKRAKRLGAGSFGEVSLYTDEKSGKSIAFKTARSKKGKDALEKEAQIYGKLMAAGPHKNVVQCYGIHEIDGETGLAMEYVEGCEAGDLFEGAEKLLQENKLSHSQYWGALQFMANEAIDGLKHVNAAGISHNDIKGGNILFDKNSQSLKIADFGFAGTIGEDPLDFGTPEYSSPEAIAAAFKDEKDRDRLDDKQDGYAVGQMIYGGGEGEFNLLGAPDCDNPYAFALHVVRKLSNSKSQDAQADEEDSPEKALTPTDDPDLAGEPGFYNESYESEYARFVNNSMQIDPQKRSSLDDMQQSQFLQDPLLQPDEAKKVLAYIMQQNSSKSASEKS
ncbi:Serine/threonine protein kinase [Pseudovibrio ascidiaceicola]|uniref:mitogen-activated protein kinase kinase n=1 Tax=Pseudovibrio ascidiaceicola TaxID=285279 RepID=A0A1I4BXJ2_9HYPH|nr:protein kinase [Pseudovibrio ascidiaceicola]SFK72726.1 Serine/threonine protein kinase [Pseudovibrio ascidiaceicola]